MIEVNLSYTLKSAISQSVTTQITVPESEPVLDLKYNFGPSGMDDVEGWVSVPFGGSNPDNLEPLPWNNTSNDRLQVTNWAQAFTITATDPLKRTHWQAASNWNAGFKITGLNPEKQYTVRLLGAVADDDPGFEDGDVNIGPDFPDSAYLTDSNVYDEQTYYLNRTGEMFTDADGPDGATEIVWESVSPNADGELYVVMGRGFNSIGSEFFPVVSYLRITENT